MLNTCRSEGELIKVETNTHSRKSRTMENMRCRDHPVIIKLHDGGRWQARSYKRSRSSPDDCTQVTQIGVEMSSLMLAWSSCSDLIDGRWDEIMNVKGQTCPLQLEDDVFLIQDQSFYLQIELVENLNQDQFWVILNSIFLISFWFSQGFFFPPFYLFIYF